MDLKEIQKPVQKYLEETDRILVAVSRKNRELAKVTENHSMVYKGKKIRSTFLFLMCGMNEVLDEGLPALAAAAELIHLTSLVHDDIVDNSNFRRGQKTLNNIIGNTFSVLAGDYFFIEALKMLNGLKNPKLPTIIHDVTEKMIEGQILEFANNFNFSLDEKTYFEIIENKTASFFSGLADIAGVLSNKRSAERKNYRLFGNNVGILFQISDDMIDIFSENSGKDRFRDLQEGKFTLPLILAFQQARPARRKKISLENENEIITLLADLEIRDKINLKINSYSKMCETFLERFPRSAYREALKKLIQFIIHRDY